MQVVATPSQVLTRPAADVIRATPVQQAANGVCYAASGETAISAAELEKMVAAVPRAIAAALVDARKAYYFVPLAVSDGESDKNETLIADRYDVALSDRAICHRNLTLGDSQCVFISTRLMDDKFSVVFEFYINVGHAFVERAGVSQEFADLVWAQVEAGARGETSLDAYDFRRQALVRCEPETDAAKSGKSTSTRKTTLPATIDEKAKTNYLTAAFSDAVA